MWRICGSTPVGYYKSTKRVPETGPAGRNPQEEQIQTVLWIDSPIRFVPNGWFSFGFLSNWDLFVRQVGVPSPSNRYLVNGDVCDRGENATEIWALLRGSREIPL